MPSQLAIDLSKVRVRAVEIDGTAKSPKVRAFVAADVPVPPPPAEGEEAHPFSYGDALRDLASQRKLVKEPSAVALSSVDVTFRDLDLPFTGEDQIDKVIKFEAESHLQLVEIDSVVVSYQVLDSDGRGGSHLLAVACQKDLLRGVLRDLGSISVDPQFADLHLLALYTALRETGYFAAPPPPAADVPPSERDRGEVVLALECDDDLTHLLVARGDTLLAARAIRLGVAARPSAGSGAASGAGEAAPAAAAPDAAPPAASAASADHSRHEHDETMVVVDDLGGDEGGKRRGDYFSRIKREVQRTLFRLGTAADSIERVLLLGPAVRDPAFVDRLKVALGLEVEVARPFDHVDHGLDAETLELANAEGTAALGVALRLLGAAGGSRIELRQEEVRYARRFDQVKVSLSCLAIVALVCVALLCIERARQRQVKVKELYFAANAVLNEYEQHSETDALRRKVNSKEATPLEAVKLAQKELETRYKDLSSELGRTGTITALPSGLDYLNSVFAAIDRNLEKIGRIEINSIDLDVGRDNGRKPQLKLRMLLNGPHEVDMLLEALKSSPAVKDVQPPNTQGAKDGRLEVSNLEVELTPAFDPRRAGGKEPTQ